MAPDAEAESRSFLTEEQHNRGVPASTMQVVVYDLKSITYSLNSILRVHQACTEMTGLKSNSCSLSS